MTFLRPASQSSWNLTKRHADGEGSADSEFHFATLLWLPFPLYVFSLCLCLCLCFQLLDYYCYLQLYSVIFMFSYLLYLFSYLCIARSCEAKTDGLVAPEE